jgi:hypothetical protein
MDIYYIVTNGSSYLTIHENVAYFLDQGDHLVLSMRGKSYVQYTFESDHFKPTSMMESDGLKTIQVSHPIPIDIIHPIISFYDKVICVLTYNHFGLIDQIIYACNTNHTDLIIVLDYNPQLTLVDETLKLFRSSKLDWEELNLRLELLGNHTLDELKRLKYDFDFCEENKLNMIPISDMYDVVGL